MTQPEGSVIVVGAGLGGLTAALALQRHGWRVRVYEQARRSARSAPASA